MALLIRRLHLLLRHHSQAGHDSGLVEAREVTDLRGGWKVDRRAVVAGSVWPCWRPAEFSRQSKPPKQTSSLPGTPATRLGPPREVIHQEPGGEYISLEGAQFLLATEHGERSEPWELRTSLHLK